MEKIIKELYETIINRKEAGNDGSYTKYLLDKGTNKILKKVGEECTEVIISCTEDTKEEQRITGSGVSCRGNEPGKECIHIFCIT